MSVIYKNMFKDAARSNHPPGLLLNMSQNL